MNAHQVTRDFELALCDYTGAPFAVTTNSCTMALLLAVAWHLRVSSREYHANRISAVGDAWVRQRQKIEIPTRTYVGVPMSIAHAGGWPVFRDDGWSGWYQLKPLPVWDSARYFTAGMYEGGALKHPPGRPIAADGMVCVSFHATKTLGIEQGGAILLDDPIADAWLRRMRFDGRTAGVPVKDDSIKEIGWHCYMNPSTAAQGLMRMAGLPRHNKPLPMSDYPDLSLMECFK